MEIIGQKYKLKKKITTKEIIDMAKEVMIKYGAISPQYLLEKEDKDGVTITSMVLEYQEEEKRAILEKVRDIVTNTQAEMAFLMNDGWATVVKEGEPIDEGEKERILIINAFSRKMQNKTYTIKVNEKDMKFGKPMLIKNFNSIWNPYIELDGAIEQQERALKEHKGETNDKSRNNR